MRAEVVRSNPICFCICTKEKYWLVGFKEVGVQSRYPESWHVLYIVFAKFAPFIELQHCCCGHTGLIMCNQANMRRNFVDLGVCTRNCLLTRGDPLFASLVTYYHCATLHDRLRNHSCIFFDPFLICWLECMWTCTPSHRNGNTNVCDLSLLAGSRAQLFWYCIWHACVNLLGKPSLWYTSWVVTWCGLKRWILSQDCISKFCNMRMLFIPNFAACILFTLNFA
jgi:hypothetical protein